MDPSRKRAMMTRHTKTQVGYCTCGKVVHGNGGCYMHSQMHKRKRDGHHYLTYDAWVELMKEKENAKQG